MRNFNEILDACLERIAAGEAVESCLADYPAEAARLEPLLQVAAGLSAETAPAISHAANRQAMARMLAAQQQNVSNLERDRYTDKSIQRLRRVREWLKELSMSRKFSPFGYGFAALIVLFGIVLFTTRGLPEAQVTVTQTQIAVVGLPSPPHPTNTPPLSVDEKLVIVLSDLPEPDRVERTPLDSEEVISWTAYYSDEQVVLFHFDSTDFGVTFLDKIDVKYVWQKEQVGAIYTGEKRVIYDMLTTALGGNLTVVEPPSLTPTEPTFNPATTYRNQQFYLAIENEVNTVEGARLGETLFVMLIEDGIELMVQPKPHFTPLLQWAIENLTTLNNTTDASHISDDSPPLAALRYTLEDGTLGYLIENNEFVYQLRGDVSEERFEEVIGRLQITRQEEIVRETFSLQVEDEIYRAVTTYEENWGDGASADIFIRRNGFWQHIVDDIELFPISVLQPQKKIDDTLFLEQRGWNTGMLGFKAQRNFDRLFALSLATNQIEIIADCGESHVYCIGDYNAQFVTMTDENTLVIKQHDGTLISEFTSPENITTLAGTVFHTPTNDLAFMTIGEIVADVTRNATLYVWAYPFDEPPHIIAQQDQLIPRITWFPTSICAQTSNNLMEIGEQCFPLANSPLPDPTIANDN